MPFHQVEVPDGSSIRHILSDRTFVLKRYSCSERVILTVYHQKAHGLKSEAGHVKAASEFESDLALDSLDSNSHFSVTYITTEYGYRNISLGVMLLFIIAREVQVNGGTHLYLQYPVSEALGFYPAPENVKRCYFDATKRLRAIQRAHGYDDPDHREIPFQDKFKMSRRFSLWRGVKNS